MSGSDAVELRLSTPVPGLRVSVYDAHHHLVGRGMGDTVLELPPGLYVVRADRAGMIGEQVVRLRSPTDFPVAEPPLFTAAPLAGAASTSSAHARAAAEAGRQDSAAPLGRPGAASGRVFVFVRAPGGIPPAATSLGAGLSITDADDRPLVSFGSDTTTGDRDEAWLALAAGCEPEFYALRLDPPDGSAAPVRHLALPVFDGWETQVFLLCADHPMLYNASVFLVPAGEGFDPADRWHRALDISMRGLAYGRGEWSALPLDEALDAAVHRPLAATVAALAMIRRRDANVDGLLVTLAGVLPGSADVGALRIMAADAFGITPPGGVTLTHPPLVREGLVGAMRAASADETLVAAGSLAERVAGAQFSDSPWTTWNPDLTAPAAPLEWVAAGIRDLSRREDLTPGADLPAHLVATLAKQLGVAPGTVQRAHAHLQEQPGEPPYPGMRPFTTADAGVFFGRRAESRALAEQIRSRGFAAVVAASGSGKSSLINAGLIPLLSTGTEEVWTVVTVRPGARPLEALAAQLRGDPAASETVERLLGSGDAERLLVVVDPFEDVFTLGTADAPAFWEALQALRGRPEVAVLLAARADFGGDLMREPWGATIEEHRFPLPPMGEHALTAAIEGPAESRAVVVGRDLVVRMIADCGSEPGVLPFVQETMRLLWRSVQLGYLGYEAYAELHVPGERPGSPPLRGIHAAIALHAERVWESFAGDPTMEAIVRRTLLRLVQFGEGRADTRRRVGEADLRSAADSPGALEHVLGVLADEQHRLLTLDRDPSDDSRTIDLAHESLLTAWPRLRRWIAEGKAAELERRRLLEDAEEWQRRDRGRSYLHVGRRLRHHQEWAAAYPGELSPVIEEFLEASARRDRTQRLLGWAGGAAAVAVVGLLAVIGAILGWGALEDAGNRRAAAGALVPYPGFRLDADEVTNRQYDRCIEDGPCTPPQRPFGEPRPDPDLPVVLVDAYQAAQFCDWVGRRLPTRTEWQQALLGSRVPFPSVQELVNMLPIGATDIAISPDLLALVNRSTVTREELLAANPEIEDLEFAVATWAELDRDQRRDLLVGVVEDIEGEAAPQLVAADSRFATDTGVTHLLGNAAEWTATPQICGEDAFGCLATWDGSSGVAGLQVVGGSYADERPRTLVDIPNPFTDPFEVDENVGFRCASD